MKIQVADALRGHTFFPVGDRDIEFVYFLIKTAGDGYEGWSYRTSGPPNDEELLGVLVIQSELVRRDILREWDGDDGPEVAEPKIERVPVDQAFPGIRIHPLESGSEPVFSFAIFKFAESSEFGWGYRASSQPNLEELLGALDTAAISLRERIIKNWE